MSNLNNRILKAKGYHLRLLEQKQFPGADNISYRVVLLAPDDTEVHSAWYTSPDDFDKVVNHVRGIGKLTGLDFERDLNASIPLLQEFDGKVAWDVTRWELVIRDDKYPEYPVLYGRNLAVLISASWLEWKGIEDTTS